MNEIDWSKAPEGTTHYVVGSIHPFEKRVGDDWFYYVGGRWESIHTKGDGRISSSSIPVVPRPTTPSWSGGGLPPVGVVCEAKWGRSGWSRCVVFAHKPNANSGVDVLVDVDGDWTFFDKPSMFRPVRTPEQIEADEREAAIDAMFARFGGVGGLTRKQCAWVIVEGYRKP